jgi:SMC interacting uncharacterized protein involved in chromosome segregation
MSEKSQNNGRAILVIVLVLLLLGLNGYLFYLNQVSNKQIALQKDTIKGKDATIKVKVNTADSLTQELEEKILEIQKLGGDTTELHHALLKLRQDLRNSRGARAGDLKKIADLNGKIEEYIAELGAKEEEIQMLKKERETVYSDNQSLKTNIAKRDDSLSRLVTIQKAKDEQIKLAQVLRVEGVLITTLDKKGKEHKEDRYKASKIDKLKVVFNFADNKVAKVETKEVMLRVMEPDGATVSESSLGGGSLKTKDNKDVPFSAKQAILFDNSHSPQSFVWTKGSEYKVGTYTIEIWCEGYVMGGGTFIVK